MRKQAMKLVGTLAVVVLLATACGDDDDGAATTTEADAEEQTVDLTLTEDSLEGVPDELTAGVVTVNLDADDPETEVDFSLVAEGTTEDEFREGLSSIVSGGPFPDFFENNLGVVTPETTMEIEAGSYFVWTEGPEDEPEDEGGDTTTSTTTTAPTGDTTTTAPAGDATTTTVARAQPEEGGEEGDTTTTTAPEGGEEEGGGEQEGPPPESFIVSELTVVEDGAGGEIPDTGSTITSDDYTFDVDVQAGDDGFNFENEGPDQFHHAIVFDFGDNDPEAVEENLIPFLESEEGGEPPPGLDIDDPEAVFPGIGTGVFGPGGRGTGVGTFEADTTYAVVCFIQDRSGGPPHVFGEDMYEVFTVE